MCIIFDILNLTNYIKPFSIFIYRSTNIKYKHRFTIQVIQCKYNKGSYCMHFSHSKNILKTFLKV